MSERDIHITRRQAIGLAVASSAALAAGGLPRLSWGGAAAAAATPSCVLTPAKTEGPYFVDERLNRSDIRTDPSDGSVQPGVPLALDFVVVRSDGDCAPVAGAQVDVWHANASGLYSDEAANRTSGKKYLRGYQITGADGRASFVTVFPGWYSGRAVHIHFKIRLDGYEFTSQLFFEPATTEAIYRAGAYAARGNPDTSNARDGIYGSDGSRLVVPLSSDGNGGYAGTFTAGLSGLPASSSGLDSTVGASLAGVGWRRTRSRQRVLRLRLALDERVTAIVQLSRNGHTFARREVARTVAGTHVVELGVGRKVPKGAARLTVSLKDTAGNRRTIRRTVTVPRRLL